MSHLDDALQRSASSCKILIVYPDRICTDQQAVNLSQV